ncbi:MAG TPA: hypothetical protein VIE68_12340 [Gemmatimonadota bacterium]|jgi:hypothetical protein
MTRPRGLTPGKARACPLCKAIILESASVCPACRHHLRFDAKSPQHDWASSVPLRVEGTIRHSAAGEPWEYSVVLAIRDENGEEITRQVLGVGALKPTEQRTFSVEVEVLTPAGAGVSAQPIATG